MPRNKELKINIKKKKEPSLLYQDKHYGGRGEPPKNQQKQTWRWGLVDGGWGKVGDQQPSGRGVRLGQPAREKNAVASCDWP